MERFALTHGRTALVDDDGAMATVEVVDRDGAVVSVMCVPSSAIDVLLRARRYGRNVEIEDGHEG